MDGNSEILVFDVGGSHIAGGIFALGEMALRAHGKHLVSNDRSPSEVLGTFQALHRSLNGGPHPPMATVIAMPNPFDYELGISYMRHKYQQLFGVNVRRSLSEYLECDPESIQFIHDATAFLMGELYQGAASQVHRTVGITLGTGVGSAFAVDGEIVVEFPGVPFRGEIWNLPFAAGTVEDAVSTRAIQRMYEERTGQLEDVREIARLSDDHPAARETFDSFGRELGKALRMTCSGFAPDRIVLGGGIARSAPLFLSAAERELADTSISLRISALGDCAPLIGAAVSWVQKHAPERSQPGWVQSVAKER